MDYSFDYDIVTKESELNSLLGAFAACPMKDEMNPLVLDIETLPGGPEFQANDRFTCELAGLAFSWDTDKAAYIPLRHTDGNNFSFDCIVEDQEQELLRRLNPYFTQWQWSNHLERFDWGVMKRRNALVNYQFCTYIQAMCTGKYFDMLRGEDGGSDAGLKSLVLREFGYAMRSIDEFALYPDGYHIERVSAETAAAYACDDANWARKLHKLLYPQVKDLFIYKLEMVVSHLTEVMEENGIPFNPVFCGEQLNRLQEFTPVAREIILSQVERQLGRRVLFALGNPNAEREMMFESAKVEKRKTPVADCLRLPIQKKSRKTGEPSTDAKTLDNLAKDFDVVHNILVHRKLNKSEDSFLTTLPTYIHPITKKIHSTFHQGGVPSGRYASSDPNAQNWSDDKEYRIIDMLGDGVVPPELQRWVLETTSQNIVYGMSINVRECVEVDDDELLVAADFRQVEFWGACELAQELGMLKMISDGHDPHTATAALMWNLSVLNVTNDFRKKGKTRNFAMLFGESDRSAAFKQGTTVEEQTELRMRHERAIPKVIQHRASIIAFGRRNGYVTTHFGRPVHLQMLYDHPDKNVQEKADRLAYNAVIQGSFSGDLTKLAMARCMGEFRNDYPAYPGSHGAVHLPIIHNGHDALMFRLTPKVRGDTSTINLPDFVAKLTRAMEIQIPNFTMPAKIDIEVGQKYGSMMKIHTGKEPYRGQSATELIAQLQNKAEANRAMSLPSVPSLELRQVIKLQLDCPPTNEQALGLKTLLTQFPGGNLVVLNYLSVEGAPAVLPISKLPTSLTMRDADKFKIVLPCKVLAENIEAHMPELARSMETV